MPSAPLASQDCSQDRSQDCPVDLDHLKRMTLGELQVEREVLELFLRQSSRLIDALAGPSAEAGALAHTLKGSAQAIGAFRLADAAAAVEEAARRGSDPAPALAALMEAAAAARSAIERLLRQP
jgi:HPt (histidine-containing phosphotransfer) domain-containing protein